LCTKRSAYLRLSTRPITQKLADVPPDPAARERRRRQVVAGAYPIRRVSQPKVTIAAMGAVLPEALAAAERLSAADVVCISSPQPAVPRPAHPAGAAGAGRVLDPRPGVSRGPRHAAGHRPGRPPAHAGLPGHHQPRAARRARRGQFGQSGSIEDLYRYNGIDTDSIIRAALDLLP
jgi:pyruvate dehydrogenase E1 component